VAGSSRAERTAAELKAAARRLLTRKTYAEIRITDITEEAGRAAGSFYRYFTDKDDLLRALVADFEAAVRGQVEDLLGGPVHRLANREDVRKHVEAYWTSYRTHHPEMSGLFQAAAVSEEFRAIHLRQRDRQVGI
jgi:AcrR family transcriptional regulator